MGEKAGEIYFGIGVDATGVKDAVKGAFADVGKQVAVLGAAYFGAKAAIGGFVDFMADSVKEASAADDAMNSLTAALGRAGVQGAAAAAKDFSDFASQIQLTTGVSGDMLTQAASVGASFGITGESLKKTAAAAVDMSKVLGTDVSGAMSAIARQAATGAGPLGRLGIEVDKNATQGQRLASILDQISDRFGGSAAEAAKTYSGRLGIVKEAWGDVQEEIGRAITQNETVNAVLVVLAEELTGVSKAAEGNRQVIADLISSGWGALVTGAKAVVLSFGAIGMAFEGFKLVGNAAIAAVVEMFRGLVYAITGGPLFDGLEKLARFGGMETLANGIASVKNTLNPVNDTLKMVSDTFKATSNSAVPAIYSIQDGMNGALATIAGVDAKVLSVASHLRNDIPAAAAAAKASLVNNPFASWGDAKGIDDLEKEVTRIANFDPAANQRAAFASLEVSASTYYSNLAAMQEKDAAFFEQQQNEKTAVMVSVGQAWTGAMASAFGAMASGADDAGKQILKAIVQAAIASITAYAASASAAAAFAEAGIPVVGPLLAVGAAAAMGAMVMGFLSRVPGAAEGGLVRGGTPGKDSVMAMLMPGELVVPTGLVDGFMGLMRGISPARSSAIPAFASGGMVARSSGAGRQVNVNLQLSAPISNPQEMTRPQMKAWFMAVNETIEDMIRDNLVLRPLVRGA